MSRPISIPAYSLPPGNRRIPLVRPPQLGDLGLDSQRVAVEHRLREAYLVPAEVGHRRPERRIAHGDADHEAEGEGVVDEPLAELGFRPATFLVEVQQRRVARQAVEPDVVRPRDRPPDGVLEHLTDLQLVEAKSGRGRPSFPGETCLVVPRPAFPRPCDSLADCELAVWFWKRPDPMIDLAFRRFGDNMPDPDGPVALPPCPALEVPYSANYTALRPPRDQDLTDITLPTGVSIRVVEPCTKYELGLQDGERCRMALQFDGVVSAWCTDRLVGAEKLGRVEARLLS